MDTVKIIEKIKNEKKLLKMTNLELSEKSGVALGTLNKILSFKTGSIKMQTLNKIFEALKNSKSVNLTKVNGDNYGFIKVATYSPEIRVADVGFNLSKIKEGIEMANEKGANLLVLPELSLTGATCGDLFYQDVLLSSARSALLDLLNFTKNIEMLVFVGMPLKVLGKVYNVAVAILKGEILGFTPKTVLTNDELRYFSVFEGDSVNFLGKTYPFSQNIIYSSNKQENFNVAVEIGDGVFTNNLQAHYSSNNGAFIIVNLSASNELVGKADVRRNYIKSVSLSNNIAYVYANAGFGESTTDLVFSGHSLICERGEILSESELFENSLTISDIDVNFLAFERSKPKVNENINTPIYKFIEFNIEKGEFSLDREYRQMPFVPNSDDGRFELILKMQANALQKRIRHINPKTLIIGVSGGLDSTLALLVAVRAMKNENRDLKDILAVTMPCFGTTSRTKNNATVLAEALGVTLKEINIKDSVLQHFKDISHNASVTDVTYENSQARERTQVLMDISNKTGGIVIGTGDLSELALGWATYNGDHMSMYSVNSSIPKTLIRYLVDYEANKSNKIIKNTLKDILDTPVSPELIPPKDGEISQKTEDIVGPYLLHDFYLYYAIRCGFKPSKIFFIAKHTFNGKFSNEVLYKWLKNFYNRFFTQQFKRSCVPDGVKIGSVGFSPRGDFIMPSDACRNEWLLDLENIIL